ncbi:MAG: 3-methyl-2-oxobutanoate hydroxymethyltransferase, partial [Verrucomicrobiia bacterium]
MTAYDVVFARLADEGGADLLHVGDTLAIAVLGFGSTVSATMEDMVRHTGAVSRGRCRALITADLPAGAYATADVAVANARRLLEAGADAVKLEGGRSVRAQVEALREAGIEVQGHIGLLPQFAVGPEGFRKKGRTGEEVESLLADAMFLEEAGA